MSYKIAPLTVNPKQKSSFMSKVFVSQPSAEEEMLVGRLFVLMDIDQSKTEDFALADFIVKEIYHYFYDNEQFFLRDKIANLKIDYIFEAAITKLNRAIAEFLETQKIPFKAGGLTIVIGVLHRNRLLFTNIGTSKAFLMYRPKTKNNQILADYNLVDISEKTEDPTQEIAHQAKLFANVVNGVIPSSGYFLFANEALLEYLSKKQLSDIITTLPPASAAEQIKILLDQTNAFVPFFGLIVKNTVGDEREVATTGASYGIPTSQTVMGGGRVSVDQLNTTQERTEELLSPSGALTVKKWLSKFRPTSTLLKNYAENTARGLHVSAGRLKARGTHLAISKKILDFGKIIVSMGYDALKSTARLITNTDTRQTVLKTIRELPHITIARLRNVIIGFHGLGKKQKILLSIVSLAVIILIVNVARTSINARHAAEEANINETKVTFEQKEHQLEASLLYNNTDGAKQILADMDTLIKNLSQKTENGKKVATELTDRYHAKLDTIFAITRLTNPTAFAELPATGDNLVLAETDLYTGNGESKNIYRIDASRQVTTLHSDTFSGKKLTILTNSGDAYMYDENNFFAVNPIDYSISTMTIDSKPKKINGVALYNNRLYVTDETDNTIYRFNEDKRSLTFSGRQNWLRDNLNVKNISSLAVNGRIFMIGDDQVKRFSNGKFDAVTFEDASPSLIKPTQIIITSDQSTLYILDPENQRVVAYNSDGRYLAQYTSSTFNNLKGLAVTEDNKKLYVLNDKTIYEIEIKK